MKTVNKNTKKGQAFIAMYNRATATSIRECYSSYSWAKARAEILRIGEMVKEGGDNYRILSYNTMQFTCGWITPAGLRIETANNSYIVK